MTAIIGWLCKDGVVIGSDSAVTFGTPSQFTIEQTGTKIFTVGENVILAGSGEVGIQQRFYDLLKAAYDKKLFAQKNNIEVGRVLSEALNTDLARTRAERSRYEALLAYTSGDSIHLCEFLLRDFQPEWKDSSLNFASIGCGRQITDPFLGFMKKVFLGESKQPDVRQARIITYLALAHVCELNTGGIKEPIQMAQLIKNDKGLFRASILNKPELQEHEAIMKKAIAHFAEFEEPEKKATEKIPSMGNS